MRHHPTSPQPLRPRGAERSDDCRISLTYRGRHPTLRFMTAAAPVRQDERARRHAAVLPYLMLSLTMLCWAGNWVVGRAVRGVMPPVALTFWRWSIAALLLAPFVLPRLRGKGPLLREHWRVLVILGFTGVALFQFLIYFGLRL